MPNDIPGDWTPDPVPNPLNAPGVQALLALGLPAAGTIAGAGIGGSLGQLAGVDRGHTFKGIGRGLVRGGMTGAGAGLGSLLGGAAPANSPGTAALLSLLGAAGGGAGGYALGGAVLGKPEDEREKTQNALQELLARSKAAHIRFAQDLVKEAFGGYGSGAPPVAPPAMPAAEAQQNKDWWQDFSSRLGVSQAVRGPAYRNFGPAGPGGPFPVRNPLQDGPMRLPQMPGGALGGAATGGPPQTMPAPRPPLAGTGMGSRLKLPTPGAMQPAAPKPPPAPGIAKASHIKFAESLVPQKSAAIGHPAAHASAAFDRMSKAAGSKSTAKKRAVSRPPSPNRGS